ncbi:alpha beta [Diplodia corticola]|uniref:Alpha beta n=1 Tax=Diplodia corticola TaxID=236234 RepID=A0A1J9QS17_9PEZI|nr:alpha beta [Diplodia corticola]OJD31750.1 alpha beta [Diplodia corticola]
MATEHSTEPRNDPAMAAAGSRFSQWFPLSPKEGWTQWCTNLSPATAEETVLSFIPHVLKPPSTQVYTAKVSSSSQSSISSASELSADSSTSSLGEFGARKWYSQLVQLSGKNRALNEFSIERVGDEVEHNLVMLHGYGAGLGFFYKNFESLSRRPGWKLYALDMLGMGRSSRPPFKIHAKDRQGKVTEAENWFVDALEEWRVQKGIGRFTLLGHSMGGYMATAYALKYPGNLEKLILVSPVGIPEDPLAMRAEIPEPTADPLQDQNISLDGAADIDNPSSAAQPERLRPTPKWLVHLWEANISPFSIIRMAGPLGPRLTSGWTSRRFAHLPQNEALALHDYSYALFRQRGSGEYALAHILAPGAFARDPLIRRIHRLGRQHGERGVPVTFMYGDHDWMDVNGGRAAEKIIKAESARALEGMTEAERKRDNGDARVVVVEKAGHHLYLDNPERFNRAVDEELQDVERRKW